MCDFEPGRLILCHHKDDPAASKLIEDLKGTGSVDSVVPDHVEYIESLEDKLHRAGGQFDVSNTFRFHLLRVPEGQEIWKINYLQFFYRWKYVQEAGNWDPENWWYSPNNIVIEPNYSLTLSMRGDSGPFGKFIFSDIHKEFRTLIGAHGRKLPSEIVVSVVDSGIARGTNLRVDRNGSLNLVDNNDNVDDLSGHGTAVCHIIDNVAPGVLFRVYRVADRLDCVSEWDVLAALAAKDDAKIVNLSLAFGRLTSNMSPCHRTSLNSRSAIFENCLDGRPIEFRPIPVAAAGNGGGSRLSYPARYSNVVAVASVDSKNHLSSFSNHGAWDQLDDMHKWLFLALGGEQRSLWSSRKDETIGRFENQSRGYWGTSFAAAYVTGILAHIIATQPNASRDDILNLLKESTIKVPDEERHGNGLVRIP
jgi:hypothetical protein